ncbi:MAG: 30S ribosomal protein S17 [Candidatus Omnitrophica bacterium]|nr:30S ribosomal protein S17 [Candidatus Omnitrophota bacterium]
MGKRKEFLGTVVSDKMNKTVVVKIVQMSKHAKYSKIAKTYDKFKAHDEKNAAKVGDTVAIEETRPLSKDKHFRVIEVVKKATAAGIEIKEEIL